MASLRKPPPSGIVSHAPARSALRPSEADPHYAPSPFGGAWFTLAPWRSRRRDRGSQHGAGSAISRLAHSTSSRGCDTRAGPHRLKFLEFPGPMARTAGGLTADEIGRA